MVGESTVRFSGPMGETCLLDLVWETLNKNDSRQARVPHYIYIYIYSDISACVPLKREREREREREIRINVSPSKSSNVYANNFAPHRCTDFSCRICHGKLSAHLQFSAYLSLETLKPTLPFAFAYTRSSKSLDNSADPMRALLRARTK